MIEDGYAGWPPPPPPARHPGYAGHPEYPGAVAPSAGYGAAPRGGYQGSGGYPQVASRYPSTYTPYAGPGWTPRYPGDGNPALEHTGSLTGQILGGQQELPDEPDQSGTRSVVLILAGVLAVLILVGVAVVIFVPDWISSLFHG